MTIPLEELEERIERLDDELRGLQAQTASPPHGRTRVEIQAEIYVLAGDRKMLKRMAHEARMEHNAMKEAQLDRLGSVAAAREVRANLKTILEYVGDCNQLLVDWRTDLPESAEECLNQLAAALGEEIERAA